jgi:hypothetical protein
VVVVGKRKVKLVATRDGRVWGESWEHYFSLKKNLLVTISRLHYLNWFYNPLIVRKIRWISLAFELFHRGFLYLRHRPHEHSQGLSFPLGYTHTRGLLRSWKINRHDISAARPRLEAGWNNGGSSLHSLFRVERGAVAKSDL